MSQEVFTSEMFYRRLREMWADRGFSLPEKDHVGITVSELVAHSVERNARRDLPYLDLWVAILDECISWFVSLYSIVYDPRRHNGRGYSDLERATTLLLSKIIADSMAIRHLVLLGFDTSARTILRSLSEYMEVLVAVLHKPSFAREFLTSDTPETAQRFWEEHLRGGKIRRKVTDAWVDFFQSRNDGAAAWFANWGRGSHAVLSGIMHPSSAGGLFSAIPLKARHVEENWLGTWGDKADISVETVYIYAQFMFPILLLSSEFPFEGYEDHIHRDYDQTEELHRHVRVGRNILASIILSVGSDSNTAHVFPDFDMSIWPDQSGADSDSPGPPS